MFILTHPVNFSVGGNLSARRKPTTFGRVLTDSFHMSGALVRVTLRKVSLRIEPAASEVKGERSDHWATGSVRSVQYNTSSIVGGIWVWFRRCLEAWHININHHALNRDDFSYLPQECLHLVGKIESSLEYTRKNLTACSKSANKLSTSCVRCLIQIVNKHATSC